MRRSFQLLFLAVAVCLAAAANVAFANKSAAFPTEDDSKRVLECNVTFGEFQAISIYSMSNGTFRMTTLNNAGTSHAYEMPSKEWSVGKLNVPCSRDENKICGTLYTQNGFWSYDFGSAVGDCR